jgi:hypothetical protein
MENSIERLNFNERPILSGLSLLNISFFGWLIGSYLLNLRGESQVMQIVTEMFMFPLLASVVAMIVYTGIQLAKNKTNEFMLLLFGMNAATAALIIFATISDAVR